MAACWEELSVSEQMIADGSVYVAENDRRMVGFYSLIPLNEQDVDVGHFFVEPDAIGQGFGKTLLVHAVVVATERRPVLPRYGIRVDRHATLGEYS
jgi:predicted GNAT family acetyltransferase